MVYSFIPIDLFNNIVNVPKRGFTPSQYFWKNYNLDYFVPEIVTFYSTFKCCTIFKTFCKVLHYEEVKIAILSLTYGK